MSASPFICLPSCVSLSGGVHLAGLVCALSLLLGGAVGLAGLVCALSPFICFPSCVSLSGGVRLSSLVCALSPFMCLPEWWCPPRRSCLRLVSLHLSPFMCLPVPRSGRVHALSPFICLPSCVSLSGGVLSGLVCALSPFICLPSCVSLSLCLVSLRFFPFIPQTVCCWRVLKSFLRGVRLFSSSPVWPPDAFNSFVSSPWQVIYWWLPALPILRFPI